MKSKKTGEDELYDRTFLQLKNDSDILSPGGRATSVYTEFWDKTTTEGRRVEYVGDQEGKFRNADGAVFLAIIPSLRERLKDINAQFKLYQDKQAEEGHRIPELMPAEMLKIKSVLEARLDIALEELKKIEDRIAFFENQKEKGSSNQVLKYGLEGNGRLSDGKLVELDGQICKKSNGIVCIIDPRSPYDGMATSDYFDLAAEWKAEIKAADKIVLKQLQEKARAENKPVPRAYNSIAAGMSVKKELLPKWPEGVPSHYAMTRKKN